MKILFLHQILSSNLESISIEGSKICEISKLTLGPYFEIFLTLQPLTQNQSFTTGTFLIYWVTYMLDNEPGPFVDETEEEDDKGSDKDEDK